MSFLRYKIKEKLHKFDVSPLLINDCIITHINTWLCAVHWKPSAASNYLPTLIKSKHFVLCSWSLIGKKAFEKETLQLSVNVLCFDYSHIWTILIKCFACNTYNSFDYSWCLIEAEEVRRVRRVGVWAEEIFRRDSLFKKLPEEKILNEICLKSMIS